MTNTSVPPAMARDPQTYVIIGSAMEVHSVLGCGFIEPVYRKPLEFEFAERGIPFQREVSFPIRYKGKPTGLHYRADFVCFGEIIVEIKAQRTLTPIDEAQTINYMKASDMKRALLLNFGATSLQYRRFAR
jgi:GxxExxY protein